MLKSQIVPKNVAQKLALIFGTVIFSFIAVEIGYRIFDPLPFFPNYESIRSARKNLTQYDPILGWRGVPGGGAQFVTRDNSVWVEHNGDGFRDIEHGASNDEKDAIVFLGDSFTWGYEVEFDDMFVNRVRNKLTNYEFFNLSHTAYGTDQELLTFRQWESKRDLKFVILMFSENDVWDNNSPFSRSRPKPKFELVDNELVLTGVPVPKIDVNTQSGGFRKTPESLREVIKRLISSSRFLSDVYFRFSIFHSFKKQRSDNPDAEKLDLAVTSRLLQELKGEVETRGARLVVFFIPSKREIEGFDHHPPYQNRVADLCDKLGIEWLDLSPRFKDTPQRTYHRRGMHWNKHGHEVAAEAIYDYLNRDTRHLGIK